MTKMKSIVFLYAGDNTSFAFDKSFNNKSAFDLSLEWAYQIENTQKVVVIYTDKVKQYLDIENIENTICVEINENNTLSLIQCIAHYAGVYEADTVIYTKADKPFLDIDLTKQLFDFHTKYIAEYTFADGYPYGFAPEVIDIGTINILANLASPEPITNECFFNIMKKDINSFEIESVIAPKDYRHLRFDFSCKDKASYLACKNLYCEANKNNTLFKALDLTELAVKSMNVHSTVPVFYNIQISSQYVSIANYNPYTNTKCYKDMELSNFKSLLKEIKDVSDSGVISLSAWGEPLCHKDFVEYVKEVLSLKTYRLLIETDGTLVTKELAEKVAEIAENDKDKIIWIVYIDAFSADMYSKMRRGGDFNKAKLSVELLNHYFPKQVYPQFTRTNENEEELESFYRYYHDSVSPSDGNVIIQKYDSFCGLLPDRKPADLSPIQRSVCWHIKRDLTILSDGSVPSCREQITENIVGNVFSDGILKIWQSIQSLVSDHINNNYCEKCRNCDEYYTFNF